MQPRNAGAGGWRATLQQHHPQINPPTKTAMVMNPAKWMAKLMYAVSFPAMPSRAFHGEATLYDAAESETWGRPL